MEALSLVHGEPTGTTSLFASLWKKGLILSKKKREKGLIVSLTTKWNYELFFFRDAHVYDSGLWRRVYFLPQPT